jgi:molybdate transport system substrate-binding protein
VLAKVALAEADAGIVYRTDAKSALDRVSIVYIPAELNVIAEYPIAVLSSTAHPELARAWLELVSSPVGQRALEGAGFRLPSGSARTQ